MSRMKRMAEVGGLFPPYQRHSDTSYTAAARVEPTAATLRREVLDFIRSRGDYGATDSEVQAALDMGGNTERPRRRELQTQGFIKDSGHRRLTPSRRQAVVWVRI